MPFIAPLLCSAAMAGEFIPPSLPPRFDVSHRWLSHGPDGPPPDDGYEFEDDSDGGNFFGRLGLTLLAAAAVSGGVYALTDGDTKQQAGNAALYMGGAGAAFFAIELAF